ncbi:MAG: hypothetical protein ACYC5X_04800 [Syntrophales bacterium]
MKYLTPEPCGLATAQTRVDVEYRPGGSPLATPGKEPSLQSKANPLETQEPKEPLPGSKSKELTPEQCKRAVKVLAPIFIERLKRKGLLTLKK